MTLLNVLEAGSEQYESYLPVRNVHTRLVNAARSIVGITRPGRSMAEFEEYKRRVREYQRTLTPVPVVNPPEHELVLLSQILLPKMPDNQLF